MINKEYFLMISLISLEVILVHCLKFY